MVGLPAAKDDDNRLDLDGGRRTAAVARAPSCGGAPVAVRRRGAELWARLGAGKLVVATACHGGARLRRNGDDQRRSARLSGGQSRGGAALASEEAMARGGGNGARKGAGPRVAAAL